MRTILMALIALLAMGFAGPVQAQTNLGTRVADG